jgi:hypothetical protein
MTDMNETTPYIILPEQSAEQQKPVSLLEKQTEMPRMVITSSEHVAEGVVVQADTAGGTTTTSGADEKPEVTPEALKRETSSPVTGSRGEEFPAGVEKVENLEVRSAVNSDRQECK